MARIQDLPEEILLLIFEYCSPSTVDHLQVVCKSWYAPAHIVSLKSIRLSWPYQLKGFISSIDSNPDPRYLAAVKELRFSAPDWGGFDVLEEQNIHKVFFRFPNLKSVCSYGVYELFERFDDRVCREFLNHCRKLETFEFTPSERDSNDGYFDLVNRLSLLLTRLDIYDLNQITEYGGIVTFIQNFPRLRYFEGGLDLLDSFRHILAILETLPNLTHFDVVTANDEEDMFAEKILKSKGEDTANAIVQRLANVKVLGWGCARDFCINSAKFIAKYFTGLDVLRIQSCSSSNDWTNQQVQGFTTTILDLAVSQPVCSLLMEDMIVSLFSVCLPAIIAKMNDRMDSPKVLLVKLLQDDRDFEDTTLIDTCLSSKSEHFEPAIHVIVKHDDEFSIQRLASEVFGQITPFHDMDEFELEIKDRVSDDALKAGVHGYNNLFKFVPSVKKMTLDVPATYEDERTEEEMNETYPLMEHLIIRAAKDVKIFNLLERRCSAAFPNLKRLELYYYCGTWLVDRGEFYLELPDYTLDHLVVDITPLVDDRAGVKSAYFVVNAKIGDKGCLFKIQKDFSAVWTIDDKDLAGLYPGSDFLLINMYVKHVGHLELYLNIASFFYGEEMYIHRMPDDKSSKYLSLSIR